MKKVIMIIAVAAILVGCKGRAEKQNPDFVEITIGEYEDFINGKD